MVADCWPTEGFEFCLDCVVYMPCFIYLSKIDICLGRFLSETAIASGVNSGLPPWNVLSVFPKTWVEFVDLDSITKDHR